MDEATQKIYELKAQVYDLLMQAELRQQEIQNIQGQIATLNQAIKEQHDVISNQSS